MAKAIASIRNFRTFVDPWSRGLRLARSVVGAHSFLTGSTMITQIRRFDRILASVQDLDHICRDFAASICDPHRGPSAAVLFGPRSAEKASLAREFHDAGSSGNKPFVAADCRHLALHWNSTSDVVDFLPGFSTISRYSTLGLLRSAHSGTLFLESADEMPSMARDELLAAIDDGQVFSPRHDRMIRIDVRVVASVDVFFNDRDFDNCVIVPVPVRWLTAFLEYFEAHWADYCDKPQPTSMPLRKQPSRPTRDFQSLAARFTNGHDVTEVGSWLRLWATSYFHD
jgi:hypothetical protein